MQGVVCSTASRFCGCSIVLLAVVQPEDRFGSPTTEDLDAFVREFARRFEEALGEALAGDIDVEVSSPVRNLIPFARCVMKKGDTPGQFEEALGEAQAGDIDVEASSPVSLYSNPIDSYHRSHLAV